MEYRNGAGVVKIIGALEKDKLLAEELLSIVCSLSDGTNVLRELAKSRTDLCRRGAYGRFKGLLDGRGLLQSWYDFENQRDEGALREWSGKTRSS